MRCAAIHLLGSEISYQNRSAAHSVSQFIDACAPLFAHSSCCAGAAPYALRACLRHCYAEGGRRGGSMSHLTRVRNLFSCNQCPCFHRLHEIIYYSRKSTVQLCCPRLRPSLRPNYGSLRSRTQWQAVWRCHHCVQLLSRCRGAARGGRRCSYVNRSSMTIHESSTKYITVIHIKNSPNRRKTHGGI